MLASGSATPTLPTGSLDIPGRGQTLSLRTRTRTLRSTTRSAVPSTDLMEVQLELVGTQSQSHDTLHLPAQQNYPTLPDDPQAQSSSTTRSSAYHDLFKALTYSSLVLENSGNLARDHLSTERTWLAYMRTSLLLAGTGVGIVQFFAITLADDPSLEATATKSFGLSTTVQRFSRPLGESALILALCLMVIGLQRYFKLQRAIMQGTFPALRTMVVLFSASLAIIMVVMCGVLLTLPQS